MRPLSSYPLRKPVRKVCVASWEPLTVPSTRTKAVESKWAAAFVLPRWPSDDKVGLRSRLVPTFMVARLTLSTRKTLVGWWMSRPTETPASRLLAFRLSLFFLLFLLAQKKDKFETKEIFQKKSKTSRKIEKIKKRLFAVFLHCMLCSELW